MVRDIYEDSETYLSKKSVCLFLTLSSLLHFLLILPIYIFARLNLLKNQFKLNNFINTSNISIIHFKVLYIIFLA